MAMGESRHRQRVEELCSGALRALTHDEGLGFRGHRLFRNGVSLPMAAPHLSPTADDDFASFRGAADGHALRLHHTDLHLHETLAPPDPMARRVFDLLEQYRVESLMPAHLPGMASNIRHRHAAWSAAFITQGLLDTEQGLLVWTVAHVCRSRVTGEPMDERTQDLVESTRMAIAPRIGHSLASLHRSAEDQTEYARHARAIALVVADMLHEADTEDSRAAGDSTRAQQKHRLSLWFDGSGDLADTALAASGRSALLAGDATASYRVFTRAHDRTVSAGSLVRAELLSELRVALDRRIAAAGLNLPKLTREFGQLLAVPEREGIDSAQEEGRIDGRMLARLVASATERRLFMQDRLQPRADVVVAFLIDCSGSMKQHAERLSLLVDVAARALDQAGVATEILGFTTGAWNGGRARREWQRAGRPQHPGRLNESCQIVFKAASQTWRQARPAIAALLKPDLFREGIDGEAVDWACGRLRECEAGRRILIVLSDGSPMDTATAQANDGHYLEAHLQDVVAHQSRLGGVEIAALGVGLDMTPYYPRSRVLDLDQPPGRQMFADLMRLLTPGALRRQYR